MTTPTSNRKGLTPVRPFAPSPFYRELQQAIFHRQKNPSPSNPRAVVLNKSRYSKSELDVVRGGKLFEDLQKNVNTLFNECPSNPQSLCRVISNDIKILTDYVNVALESGEQKDQLLKKELVNSTKARCDAVQSLSGYRDQLDAFKNALNGLNQRQRCLQEEKAGHTALMLTYQKKKEQEQQKRLNALIGLIPFVEPIRGIKRREFKRIIPLYPQIQGCISIIRGDEKKIVDKITQLYNAQIKISFEINSILKAVKKQQDEIDKIQGTIKKVDSQVKTLGKTAQQSGRDLTILRKMNRDLMDIQSKCQFLKINVVDTMELVEIPGRDNSADVQVILNSLNEIQQIFCSAFGQKFLN